MIKILLQEIKGGEPGLMALIFALIIITAVAFLVSHTRLMRRLNRVEEAAQKLENALRDRLDIIVDWVNGAPEDDGLAGLAAWCEAVRDAEPDELMKAWPKIDRAFKAPQDERFAESDRRLTELAQNYNDAIAPLNAMLTKYPWKLYAGALMIKKEKDFRF
jgi:hypothetical protein